MENAATGQGEVGDDVLAAHDALDGEIGGRSVDVGNKVETSGAWEVRRRHRR